MNRGQLILNKLDLETVLDIWIGTHNLGNYDKIPSFSDYGDLVDSILKTFTTKKDKPREDIKPPKYDKITEGYNPLKNKEKKF